MKVVLAFSGGLDTSFCAVYLTKEFDHEVIAITVNTGGFTKKEQEALSKRAYALGVKEYKFLDMIENFYVENIRYLLFGNVLKNNTYPLSVSAERVFQAKAIANFAKEHQAEAICHGSTGAGNDQIRFDLVFHALCPEMKIITPVRDNQLSRSNEIDYLQKHGININWEKSKYSINQGLWGTSIGGKETLTSDQPLPNEAYTYQPTLAENRSIAISFEKGEPITLDGKKGNPTDIIFELAKQANAYAIGQDMHVGDTIIGTKGRVGFEAAAPLILIKAHHLLEKHTLSKHQLFIKDQIAPWYGQLMHEGQYLDPVMRDIESFLLHTQTFVTGTVQVMLAPHRFILLGVTSPHDLMQSDFAEYGETVKGWTAAEARGFAKIYANSIRLYQSVHEKN